MKNILCQFDLIMKYFQSENVMKELIDNYEAIQGSLVFINQSLWDCQEFMSGPVEAALSDIARRPLRMNELAEMENMIDDLIGQASTFVRTWMRDKVR
ncbi:hypothetical protein AUF12_16480 [Enterococcus avium]|uniref:hypothetical protein n=1 Tax=Enterococcus avium TaxID=33945 RepID=UPI000C9A5B4F|nr:hypothetical protein [Enterococcus avium]PNE48972.1 hypothetical protein AUF12_16480 [Enterococcus avium]